MGKSLQHPFNGFFSRTTRYEAMWSARVHDDGKFTWRESRGASAAGTTPCYQPVSSRLMITRCERRRGIRSPWTSRTTRQSPGVSAASVHPVYHGTVATYHITANSTSYPLWDRKSVPGILHSPGTLSQTLDLEKLEIFCYSRLQVMSTVDWQLSLAYCKWRTRDFWIIGFNQL